MVGVKAVTCRKAHENEAVLAKPNSADTRATAFPRASRSIACTIRARCRQDFSVSPVSAGNSRLTVRTDVAARDASSLTFSRFWRSSKARSATRRPTGLVGKGRKVGACAVSVSSCSINLATSSTLSGPTFCEKAASSRERISGVTRNVNGLSSCVGGAQASATDGSQWTIHSSASVSTSTRCRTPAGIQTASCGGTSQRPSSVWTWTMPEAA